MSLEQEIKDGTQAQMEKAKLNLVIVGMFSVIMLFAGFSSAYIVSMGDSFWLKVPLPSSFWISTAIIVLSSIVLFTTIKLAQRGNATALKAGVSITFILGLAFVYFQFKGYGQLVDNGVHATFNKIVVTDGRYGDYFEVKKGDEYIEVNGNDFYWQGRLLTDQEMKGLQDFMSQFTSNEHLEKQFVVENYGEYKLTFHSRELTVENKQLKQPDGKPLPNLDRKRLHDLALNIRDGRGDFFVRGKMGKDFHVYYKGKELEYKNRDLYWKGAVLSPYLQVKAMESSDTASSYLYILTFAHLLHVIVTILFLLRAVIYSFTGRINVANTVSLRMTGIFWHFLGALWLFLLLFLLFIH